MMRVVILWSFLIVMLVWSTSYSQIASADTSPAAPEVWGVAEDGFRIGIRAPLHKVAFGEPVILWVRLQDSGLGQRSYNRLWPIERL